MMTEETPNPLKKVTPYLSLSRDGHPAPSIEMLSLLSIRKDVCYHPSGAVNVLSWSKPSKLRHVTNDPHPGLQLSGESSHGPPVCKQNGMGASMMPNIPNGPKYSSS